MRAEKTIDFTPFEIMITVALVAVLAMTVVPPLLQNINEGKIARAQSDTEVLGAAILEFYKDVGRWPTRAGEAGVEDIGELELLVSNARLGGGTNGLPEDFLQADRRIASATQQDKGALVGTLTDHLVRNATRTTGELYTTSKHPHLNPGWNGPYLDRVPLDPWNSPYVVNIRRAGSNGASRSDGAAGFAGRTATSGKHLVLVLSAGPNRVFETTFTAETGGSIAAHTIRGDDIGCLIQKDDDREY